MERVRVPDPDVRIYQTGMHGMDGDPDARIAAREFIGEQYIGQLGLPVGAQSVVMACKVQVVKMDLSVEM